MFVRIVSILVAGSVLPSYAQSRTWSKRSEQVIVDEDVHATWTDIHTSDAAEPYLARMLYEDDGGRLLVLRTQVGQDDDVATVSIKNLATSEVLDFIHDRSTKTVTLKRGGADFVIDFGEREEATGFDQEITNNAIGFLTTNLSTHFQSGLRRLAEIGCLDTVNLYITAFLPAELFYDDINCKEPPAGDSPKLLEFVQAFDPATDPPDIFEQQFGANYYQ